MRDRAYVVVLAVVLTGFTFMLLAGHGPWAGREFVQVSHSHGLNYGDVPVILAWAAGMFCCWRLWGTRG